MSKKWKIFLVDIIIVAVLIVLDQVTKYFAISSLKGKPPIVLIKGILEFSYLENRGSAFGMLQNQKVFILFVGIILLIAVLYFLFKLPEGKKYLPLHICISGIIAGGIGNMIDRIRFDYVVDFISFVLIHFPTFNVADCSIVISVIFLLILFLFVYKEKDLDFINLKQNKYREM